MRVSLYRDYKEEGWESMEVYADNLATALRGVCNDIYVHEYTALPSWSRLLAKNNKIAKYFFRFIVNPLFARWHQGDINHIIDQANAHLLAVLNPRITVVTCHDLIVPYWVMDNIPQNYKKRIKRIGELWRIRYLKKAEKIIAVSQATKDHLITTLPIDPDKVVVIPEGVDEVFRKKLINSSKAIVKKTYNLPPRYVLHVGTTHEYKNMEALLALFAGLRKYDKKLFLVKVGAKWTNSQQTLIRRLSVGKYIHHVGFVPKEDLPYIYSAAAALIHPSHIEGFGFTVLEAMASGCPVVVSDIPALREMVGAAGMCIQSKVNRDDVQHVSALLGSPARLSRLIRLGRKRAAFYTWSRAAASTHRLYQDIYNRHKETQ